MDKQSLKKHHFWILLALSVVLIPVMLGGTFVGVGSTISDKIDKIDRKRKELTAVNPKSQHYIDELEKQKVELDKRRREVWRLAFDAQNGLIHWPERLKSHDQDYFGDPIPDNERDQFRNPEVYQMQMYESLRNLIAPTQFNGGSPYSVLRFTNWDPNKLPTNEDVWLALEDYCVEREVLNDIHAVNQMLAAFLPVPNPAELQPGPEVPLPDRDKARAALKQQYDAKSAEIAKELTDYFKVPERAAVGRFISPMWQLDLAVARAASGRAGELEFRYKLTNTSQRRQNIAKIDFKVYLSESAIKANEPVTMEVQAEYLAAGATYPADKPFATTMRTGSLPGTKIYKVEQKLDLDSAPVKRLDRLELGYLSHRFANRALVASGFSQQLMTAAAASAPAATPDTMSGSRAGGAAASDAHLTSANGIPRLRYLDRTDQVRRMPIAFVLVVDQAHVQDVQRAFANSRLRFQNAQFHWDRYRGPNITSDSGTGPRGGGAGAAPPGGAPPGGGMGTSQGAGGGAQPPGRGGRGAGDPARAAAEEKAANLVEMSVYGLVSLYERFPPKGQPSAGGTDAAPSTAPPAAGVPQPPPPGLPQPPPPGVRGGGER